LAREDYPTMADDEPKTTAMSVASLPRPHRTRRSTAVLALLLSAACATAGADYEDNTADGTAGWWSRLFGADEAQVQGYADQLDSASTVPLPPSSSAAATASCDRT